MMAHKVRNAAVTLLAAAIGGGVGVWHWYAKPLETICDGLGSCLDVTYARVGPSVDDLALGLLAAVIGFATIWALALAAQPRPAN